MFSISDLESLDLESFYSNYETLPPQIRQIAPQQYDQLRILMKYEKFFDQTLDQHLAILEECKVTSPALEATKYTLKITIFNTHENQRIIGACNLLDEDLVYSGAPSWTLHVRSELVENRKKEKKKCYLGDLFHSIVVETPIETIVWDRRRPTTSREVEGFILKRIGSEEVTLNLSFLLRRAVPTYQLSEELSCFCQMSEASMSTIVKCLWTYAAAKGLLRKDDTPSINLDSTLKKLFETEENFISISSIPKLLGSHVAPPKPLQLSHKIKLSGDWLDHQTIKYFDLPASAVFGQTTDNIYQYIDRVAWKRYLNRQAEIKDSTEKILTSLFEKMYKAMTLRVFGNYPKEYLDAVVKGRLRIPLAITRNNYQELIQQMQDNPFDITEQPWIYKAVKRYLRLKNVSMTSVFSNIISAQESDKKRPQTASQLDAPQLLSTYLASQH